MSNPLVSIIIPVYNVENVLRECLESAVNQTYENTEIIIVDDGSTDDSYNILKEYAVIYDSINLISQQNMGQSYARNKGIDISKGKYIFFLDSDDFILSNTLEVLIRKMEKNNLDLIRFAAEPFTDNHEYKINNNKYDFKKYFDITKVYSHDEFIKVNYQSFSASPVLYIVKKDLLSSKQLKFNSSFSMYEDELFTLELFLNVNTAMYDERKFYKRRYRINSIMTSNTSKEKLKKSFDIKYEILKEMHLLLCRYKKDNEIKLIKERIKVNNKILMLKKNQ